MRLMGRRWWGIAAAAAIAALIVGTTVFYHPTSTNQPVVAEANQEKPQDFAPQQTTEQSLEVPTVPSVETQNLASQSAPKNLASQSAAPKTSHKRKSNVRRLQAENAKLAQENERLQRELADLRRRAFIIDLEANGYKTVMNEDGSIVLIDLEQELENELNNQPTSNIPAL